MLIILFSLFYNLKNNTVKRCWEHKIFLQRELSWEYSIVKSYVCVCMRDVCVSLFISVSIFLSGQTSEQSRNKFYHNWAAYGDHMLHIIAMLCIPLRESLMNIWLVFTHNCFKWCFTSIAKYPKNWLENDWLKNNTKQSLSIFWSSNISWNIIVKIDWN